MHILQKRILDLLRQNPSMRYSEMQPDDIESSHFKYHLNQLIKDNLVSQQSRGVYCLTDAGKAAVDRLSAGRINPQTTPKVITYTLLSDDDYYYLQRKDKEPYLGLLNMIGGKVHTGEHTADASKRELIEKIDLSVPSVTLSGIAEIRIYKDAVLLTHAVAYVYTAAASVPELTAISKADIDQQSDLAPDTLAIIKAVERTTRLWSLNLDINL